MVNTIIVTKDGYKSEMEASKEDYMEWWIKFIVPIMGADQFNFLILSSQNMNNLQFENLLFESMLLTYWGRKIDRNLCLSTKEMFKRIPRQ